MVGIREETHLGHLKSPTRLQLDLGIRVAVVAVVVAVAGMNVVVVVGVIAVVVDSATPTRNDKTNKRTSSTLNRWEHGPGVDSMTVGILVTTWRSMTKKIVVVFEERVKK
jgi:hypothetical protein